MYQLKVKREWLGAFPQEVNNETIVVQVKIKVKTKDIEIPRDKIAKARHFCSYDFLT